MPAAQFAWMMVAFGAPAGSTCHCPQVSPTTVTVRSSVTTDASELQATARSNSSVTLDFTVISE